jgi:hypothetical protein
MHAGYNVSDPNFPAEQRNSDKNSKAISQKVIRWFESCQVSQPVRDSENFLLNR